MNLWRYYLFENSNNILIMKNERVTLTNTLKSIYFYIYTKINNVYKETYILNFLKK